MKTRLIISIAFIFCLLSCQSGKDNGQHQVQYIDIPKVTSKDTAFLNHFELESVVPLETTDSSIVFIIRRMIVKDDYILILSRHNVLKFSRDGKFLCQIGCQGHGPGEYTHILDISVNDEDKTIVVYVGDKMLYYTEEGQYLRQERLKEIVSFISFLIDDGVSYFFNTYNTHYDKVVYKMLDGHLVSCGDIDLISSNHIYGQLFVKSKSILFAQNNSNVIYELKNGVPFERFRLNNPNFSANSDKEKSMEEQFKTRSSSTVTSIRETDGGVFLKTNIGEFVWIKPNGDTQVLWSIKEPETGVSINYVAHSGNDNLVAFYAYATDVVKREKHHPNEMIEFLLQTVTEDSNPVILFYKRKPE